MNLSLRATSAVATIAIAIAGMSTPALAAPGHPAAVVGHDDGLTKSEAKAIGHPLLAQALGRHGNHAGSAFRDLRTTIDGRRMAHVAVQQTYRGVPVWGGQAIAHLDSTGELTSLTDGFVSSVKAPTSPSITSDRAVTEAKAGAHVPAAEVASGPDL